MRISSFVLGLTAGLVSGAAAVLMTTPQSGKELQLSLKAKKEGASNTSDEFKQRFSSIKDAVNTIKTEAKTTAPDVIAQVKTSIQHFQQDTAPIQDRLKGNIEAMQQSVESIEAEIEAFQEKTMKKRT